MLSKEAPESFTRQSDAVLHIWCTSGKNEQKNIVSNFKLSENFSVDDISSKAPNSKPVEMLAGVESLWSQVGVKSHQPHDILLQRLAKSASCPGPG